MLQKSLSGFFLVLSFWLSGQAKGQVGSQPCGGWNLKGAVFSAGSHSPVSFATLHIPARRLHFQADSLGRFSLCLPDSQPVQLLVRSFGYDSLWAWVSPKKRRWSLHLREKAQWLDAIDVVENGRSVESEVTEATVVKEQALRRAQGQSLGELVSRVPGVGTIQSGPTLFKPVIQGMTGQRIAIFQNGVRLEGQQWGFDHAPETDPGLAERLVVLKGAQSVRLGSDAIGGGILLEHTDVDESGRLKLGATGGYATNNRGYSGRLRMEQRFGKGKRTGIRLLANGRNFASSQTPQFVLGNTALRETSVQALVQHRQGKWMWEGLLSHFQTRVGIFTGSHVSSQEGIRRVFNRPDSSFRYPFSRSIDRPSQQITHQILKLRSVLEKRPGRKLEFQYSFQRDIRQEFDLIRRSSACPDCPQLRLSLLTQMAEFNQVRNREGSSFRWGPFLLFQSNDTRFRTFIPDFLQGMAGAYAVKTWFRRRWIWEAGARFETRHLRVTQGQSEGNGQHNRTFFTYMGNVGGQFALHPHWHWKTNAMLAMRAPHVSELYSNGVHHGSAGFEQGDNRLKPEKIVNVTTSLHHKSAHWEVLVHGFATYSPGYIYLSPMGDSVLLTIRGAFPFFMYRQSEVTLWGGDGFAQYKPIPAFGLEVRTQAIRSWNHTDRDYLIFQPADRLDLSACFEKAFPRPGYRLDIRFGPLWVARQNRFPADREIIPPPPGYTLWQGQVALHRTKGRFPFDLSLEVRNLFDTRYREYLNRFRYFAPEMGRNFLLRLHIPILS